MNSLDIKYTIRQLIRKKYYTLLNVFGLGIGLGCAMLMAIYLIHEFSFDRYHSKAPVLYRVVNGKSCTTPYGMGEAFRKETPEILNLFRIYGLDEVEIIKNEESFTEKSFFMADSSIFSMLDFEITAGNRNALLNQLNDITISEKIARKYFPGENPIGQSLKIRIMSNDLLFNITGVYKDFPSYSSLQADFITHIGNAFNFLQDIKYSLGFTDGKKIIDYTNDWKDDDFMTFIQLSPFADKNDVSQKCSKICQNNRKEKIVAEIYLQPFTDIYLHSNEYNNIDSFKVNQLKSLEIFLAIGLLILLIACINFILISNADTDLSIAEIACRKVNGASRIQIITISLFKTCFVAFLSLIPALLFVNLTLPVFNNLFQKELTVSLIMKWPYLISFFSITLITGIVAGIYLGFYVSGVSPTKLFHNRGASGRNNGNLKGSLVIIQFIAFILLVTCFMFMQKQYDYSLKKDLGLNTKNVLVVWLNNNDVIKNAQVICNKLIEGPNVQSCVLTSFMTPPTDNILNIQHRDKETGNVYKLEGLVFGIGELELLRIPIIKGESFTQTNAIDRNNIIINEATAKLFKVGIGNNIADFKIIGIVSNFHFHSIHQPVGAIIIFSQVSNCTNLLIKSNGNNAEVQKHLKEICKTIAPGYTYENEMLEDRIAQFYIREEKQIGTIAFFSVIALALSIMGLLGFVSINLGKRTKEIGIRKINGAKLSEILQMFYIQYIRWIIMAFIIACPIAWYAMYKWLQNFAYKTELSWWVFVVTGILTLLIVLLTVSWQSWRAATRNPVEALRYE